MIRLAQFISIALSALGVALPTAAFDASDLEGQWYGSGMLANTELHEPVLWDLLLFIDAEGVPSGLSNRYLPDDGTWVQRDITAGPLPFVLNVVTGTIHGSFLVGTDTWVSLDGFQMNLGKDLITGVNATANPETEPSVLTFVKRGTEYQNANLKGKWWLFGFYEDFGEGSVGAGYIRGTLNINDNAIIESGSLSYEDSLAPVEIPGDTALALGGTGGVRVDSPETSLAAALDDAATAVAVDATSGFLVGDYIVVGEEYMLIGAIPPGSTSFTVVRGQLESVATSHVDGASVSKAGPLGGDLYWRLAAGKTLMIGNSVGGATDGRNRHQLFQWVKLQDGALPANLGGEWRVAQFEDASAAGDPSAAGGALVIDEAGTAVTGGSLTLNDGTTVTVSGGGIETTAEDPVFAIPALGYEGTSVESDVEMALSPERDVFFGFAMDTDGHSSLIAAVKLPEPAASVFGLVSLGTIAVLRRRSRLRR